MLSNCSPLTLCLPSDPCMLKVARAFVETTCHLGSLDDRATYAVVMACGEAFSNIVRHAHRDIPNATLQIQCLLTNDGIEIQFHDMGQPFDIQSVPEFDPTELRIGGRGVYMMRKLMDRLVSCQREGGGNTLLMFKGRESHIPLRNCG